MNPDKTKMPRAARCCALAVAAFVLASCGGGGEQVSSYRATRVVAFGDESSVVDDSLLPGNGRKYGVNGTVSDTDLTPVCQNNPIWVQQVALAFSLVLPQCNSGTTVVANPLSRIRAKPGARAADMAAQVDAQLAEAAFQSTDLATVLMGTNDIIAQYAQYPAVGEPQLTANVEAAGAEIGRQINRIADAGGRVVVATAFDVGLTPYGIAQHAANVDVDRAALLSRLSFRLNASLRATIYNDGKRIGLVLLDEFIQTVSKFPTVGGYSDVTTPVCDLSKSALVPPSVLDCNTATLITNGSSVTYLWADDRHLSAGGQASLANLATARALYNPF